MISAIYLPQSYEPHERHPVLLMFETLGGNAEWLLQSTRAREVADEKQLVLMMFGKPAFQPWTDADVAEVRRDIELGASQTCVDPKRVFALGHGTGGPFARSLACHMNFAAVAAVGDVNLVDDVRCQIAPPVPFIRIAGKEDPYVPLDGGPSCMGALVDSIETVEARWTAANGCTGQPKTKRTRGGECRSWQCDADFVSCRIAGGHQWPDSPKIFELGACAGRPLPTFPIMGRIIAFFEAHGLDEEGAP